MTTTSSRLLIPESVLGRRSDWPAGLLPPDAHRPFAYRAKESPNLRIGARPSPIGVDESRVSATAVITTLERDRMGDEVVPEGCDLTHYRKNPIVLWGHQASAFPVGTAEGPDGLLSVTVAPGREVRATCYFHQATKEAVQVFDLVRLGVIRGISIGFNPLSEPVPLPRTEAKQPPLASPFPVGAGAAPRAYHGFRYDRWELLEWSFVGIPTNPHCAVVRECLSRGRLAGEPIAPAVRKSLEHLAEPARVWSHGWTAPTPSGQNAALTLPTPPPDVPPPPMRTTKAMSESTGAAGGFTTLDPATKEAICNCARRHAEASKLYYHPEHRHCWQQHGADTSEEVLKLCRDSLAEAPGVTTLTQSEAPPPRGCGWKMCHPKDMDWAEEEEGGDGSAAAAATAPAASGEEEGKKSLTGDGLRLTKDDDDDGDDGDDGENKPDLDPAIKAMSGLPAATLESMLANLAAGPRRYAKSLIPGMEAIGCPRELALAVAVAKAGAFGGGGGGEEEEEEDGDSGDGESGAPVATGGDDGGGDADDGDDDADFESLLAGMDDDDEQEEESDEVDLPAMMAEMIASASKIQEEFNKLKQSPKQAPPPPPPAAAEPEEEEEEEEGDEGDHQQLTTEDILARYRQPRSSPPRRTKATARPSRVKRLAKTHWRAVKEAMEHCRELSEMEPGAPLTNMHRAACRAHAASLKEAYETYNKEDDGGGDDTAAAAPSSSPDVPEGGDGDATTVAATATPDTAAGGGSGGGDDDPLKKSLERFDAAFYGLTGRAVS